MAATESMIHVCIISRSRCADPPPSMTTQSGSWIPSSPPKPASNRQVTPVRKNWRKQRPGKRPGLRSCRMPRHCVPTPIKRRMCSSEGCSSMRNVNKQSSTVSTARVALSHLLQHYSHARYICSVSSAVRYTPPCLPMPSDTTPIIVHTTELNRPRSF